MGFIVKTEHDLSVIIVSYNCKQLLDDILEVGTTKKMNAHFLGSVVYVHDDVYTSSKIKEQ